MLKSYQHLKSALVTLAVVCALVGATSPAQAQSPVGECKARIVIVQEDLDGIYKELENYNDLGGIGGGNPSQTYLGLLSKLNGATDKWLPRVRFRGVAS